VNEYEGLNKLGEAIGASLFKLAEVNDRANKAMIVQADEHHSRNFRQRELEFEQQFVMHQEAMRRDALAMAVSMIRLALPEQLTEEQKQEANEMVRVMADGFMTYIRGD
jgi:hypothetical protein